MGWAESGGGVCRLQLRKCKGGRERGTKRDGKSAYGRESMVGVAKSGNQQHSGKEGMLPLIASSSLSPSFLLRWGSNNADAVTNGEWRGGLVRKRSFLGDRGIWGEIMLGNTVTNKTVLIKSIDELSSSILHFLGGVGKLAVVL